MVPRGADGWLTGVSVSVRVVTDAVVTGAVGDDPGAAAAREAVRRFDADDKAGSTVADPTVEAALGCACGVGGVESDEETRRDDEVAMTSDGGSAEAFGTETVSGVSTRSTGAVAASEPESVPMGSGVGSDSGSSAPSDPAEAVSATSVLCAAPVPGAAGVDGSSDDEAPVAAVESSSAEAEFEPFGDLGTEVGLDAPASSAEFETGEPDPFEDVEFDVDPVSEGCATAPGDVVTIAAPIPSTMANAPTHLSYPIPAPCLDRTYSGCEHYADGRVAGAVMLGAEVIWPAATPPDRQCPWDT